MRKNPIKGILRFKRDERGVQLAEIAIVIPITLMLFASAAEFGRWFYEYTTLAKAARDGARYLSTAAITKPEEIDRAKKLVVYGNINGTGEPILKGLSTSNIEVTKTGVPGVPTTVTVGITDYKFKPIVDIGKILNKPKLSLAVDVKPSVTMQYMLTQPSI